MLESDLYMKNELVDSQSVYRNKAILRDRVTLCFEMASGNGNAILHR